MDKRAARGRSGGKASAAGGRNLVIMSGPAGTGKTTVGRALPGQMDILISTSATTRRPRPGEVDGRDYYFVTEEEFQRRVDAGRFVEWAEVFGRHYGTPVEEIARAAGMGKPLLLEIDVQGGIQIRNKYPEALAILLLPPGPLAQRERLSKRGTETPEELERRFQKARDEVRMARESKCYDFEVVNDDLEAAVREVVRIIQAWRTPK